MTNMKSPDWDPDEQEAFDDYVPEFIEAIEMGYLDDHLRDVARALWERRGVLEGKPLVTQKPQPKKRMLPAMARKKRAEAQAALQVAVEEAVDDDVLEEGVPEPSKADNPSGLHPNAYGLVMDPHHGVKVFVGKLKRKSRYFSGSFKWVISEDEVYYFSKTKLPGLNIYIAPHVGIETSMHGEIFHVTKVNNTTVEGIVKTFTGARYNMRSNSPWLKSLDEQRVIKVPIQVLRDNLDLP